MKHLMILPFVFAAAFSGSMLSGNAVAAGSDRDEEERVLSADIIEEVACASTSSSRVLCWASPGRETLYWTNPELLHPPTDLINPKEIIVNNFAACVATDLGVRCWGGDAKELQEKASAWRNSHGLQLFIQENWKKKSKFESVLCAMTDQDVKCTNGQESMLPKQASFPDQIFATNAYNLCVRKGGEFYCAHTNDWETIQDASNLPSGLDGFRDVSVVGDGLNACGISSSAGLSCWGNSKFMQYLKPQPGLKNARKVVATDSEVCVITSGFDLKCWSASYRNANLVPDSFDIRDVFVSGNSKCVINSFGKMRCISDIWGGYGNSLTVPKEIGF